MVKFWSRRSFAFSLAAGLALLLAGHCSAFAQRLDGFNVIMTPSHPFGSTSARHALAATRRLGATTVAIVPFLWQSSPSSPTVVRGDDMTDDALRAGIRDARALGLKVIVKPHVWIAESWAGAIEYSSEDDWRCWFSHYGAALEHIADIAAQEDADVLAIGTELTKTSHRAEWTALISRLRLVFPRALTYFAHNVEEALAVEFWTLLDFIGVTLYPPLGSDHDRAGRTATMEAAAVRLDALAHLVSRPVLVGEIGLRSAAGATAKPWESAEERPAEADPLLQAEVLADWLTVLDRPAITGILVWRWLTDFAAGGALDTDFSVQNKPAEGVLLCAWRAMCTRR